MIFLSPTTLSTVFTLSCVRTFALTVSSAGNSLPPRLDKLNVTWVRFSLITLCKVATYPIYTHCPISLLSSPVCLPFFKYVIFMPLVVKNPPANAGDVWDLGSIPGSGRSPGGEQDNPLQYSCLENTVDRGAWRTMIHRVAQNQTWRKRLSMHSWPTTLC